VPVATTYTEASLAQFLDLELGPVADVLGWTATGAAVESYAHPVNRALRALGVATISEATDLEALEKVAIREAWRVAVNHLAAKIDFSLDQQSFKRSQLFNQAKQALLAAEDAAAEFDTSAAGTVTFTPIRDVHDPYVYVEDEDRVA
jgi:hypothetical protein